MVNFKSIPFLKILFPYLIGVICALYFGVLSNIHTVCFISFVVLVVTFLFQKFYKPKKHFKQGVFIISLNLFLFFLASESCYLYNAKNNAMHYTNYVVSSNQPIIVTISDIPVVSEKFIKLNVTINSIQSNNAWHYAEGNTLVYFKNDSSIKFDIGNRLLLNTKFSYLTNPKNPKEFDYKSFLENKNIFHTIFANSNNTHIISTNNKFQLSNIGIEIKAYLVSVLRNSQLSQEAFSICSALLVGYDDEIEGDVLQSFSRSGTLHVLSVSGMHTAVLYGVLIFLFSFFDKYDKYKKTKFTVVILILWLFVLITGLSPSILRAALMLSLVLFGKTFYKQGNSYNTLLLSAFILLLYNPYLIKDVGFLLSYSAVFGIMYLHPILQKTYSFENKIIQNLWSTVLMSISATLFTLPISLYFFHQFPIWFIFSNLIIIPISMLIMGAAALFILFYKISVINQVLVFVINSSTSLMLWFAKLTDNSSYGFIDMISFNKLDFLFSSLLIMFFLIVIFTKQYKHVLAFCSIIIIWLSFSIYNNYKESLKKEMIVFHVKQKSVLAFRIGNTIYGDFNTINSKDFDRYVKPYLLTVSDLKIVNSTANVFKYASKTVLKANHTAILPKTIEPNYIIISNNTPIELTTNDKTKPLIIADCSNSYKFVKKLKKQCAQLEIPFYSVKESGAFQVNL